MDENKKFWETQSLPLAAAIVSSNIPLSSLSRSSDGKYIFVFELSNKLQEIVDSFWRKALKIEANSFWEAQRFLKNRMYGS